MKFKKILLIILLILIICGIATGIYMLNKKVNNEIGTPTTVTTTTNTNESTDADLVIGGYESPEINISDEEIITIDENVFMTMLNELYLNYEDYEGKVIELIGFTYNDEYTNSLVVGREYYCCGIDSYIVGFECNYASNSEKIEYEDDKWVKIIRNYCIKRG